MVVVAVVVLEGRESMKEAACSNAMRAHYIVGAGTVVLEVVDTEVLEVFATMAVVDIGWERCGLGVHEHLVCPSSILALPSLRASSSR